MRPVRATLHFVGVGIPDVGEDPFEFSGTLRFLGTATRSLSGRSGSQGTSDWEGVRRSECAVDLVAPKDGAPLTKIEGACAIANGHFEGFAGTAHEPDGTRGEWLALRALHDAAVFDRYHRALLKTPRSETGCPPLIDIHDVVKSEAEPTRIVYRIGFPCVGEVEHITQQAISIAGPVYLATIDEAEPTRLVSSGTLTKESEPAETFDLERLRWDTNSYALRLARHHQQHKVGVLRQSLWLLRADGRLGPELTLPERDDMSIPIACANDTHSRTAHVVDLDGRPPLDLLLRHVQKSVRAGTLPGESPDRCYDLPDKVAFVAYVTDPKTLRLQPAPLPGKEKSEALVAAHPPIAALSDTWSSLSGASPP